MADSRLRSPSTTRPRNQSGDPPLSHTPGARRRRRSASRGAHGPRYRPSASQRARSRRCKRLLMRSPRPPHRRSRRSISHPGSRIRLRRVSRRAASRVGSSGLPPSRRGKVSPRTPRKPRHISQRVTWRSFPCSRPRPHILLYKRRTRHSRVDTASQRAPRSVAALAAARAQRRVRSAPDALLRPRRARRRCRRSRRAAARRRPPPAGQRREGAAIRRADNRLLSHPRKMPRHRRRSARHSRRPSIEEYRNLNKPAGSLLELRIERIGRLCLEPSVEIHCLLLKPKKMTNASIDAREPAHQKSDEAEQPRADAEHPRAEAAQRRAIEDEAQRSRRREVVEALRGYCWNVPLRTQRRRAQRPGEKLETRCPSEKSSSGKAVKYDSAAARPAAVFGTMLVNSSIASTSRRASFSSSESEASSRAVRARRCASIAAKIGS